MSVLETTKVMWTSFWCFPGLFAFPSLSVFGIRRCWMNDNSKAWLAHYFTNLTILVILVFSGIVMLSLVYREIRNRDEWRQNRVAFLSIWGLSCLFGTTWGLTFLNFGFLTDFVLFLSCILNSFQGLCLWQTPPVQTDFGQSRLYLLFILRCYTLYKE